MLRRVFSLMIAVVVGVAACHAGAAEGSSPFRTFSRSKKQRTVHRVYVNPYRIVLGSRFTSSFFGLPTVTVSADDASVTAAAALATADVAPVETAPAPVVAQAATASSTATSTAAASTPLSSSSVIIAPPPYRPPPRSPFRPPPRPAF